MNEILKKIVRKACGGSATCERYLEVALDNFVPKGKVAYKCTCDKKTEV